MKRGSSLLSLAAFALCFDSAAAPARDVCLAPTPAVAENGFTIAELELALGERGGAELSELFERGAARAGSLGIDVDHELDDDAERSVRELLPRLTAARAWYRPLAAERGYAPASCQASGAVRLWNDPERAPLALRHAAWAISAAALLESEDPKTLAERLRRQSEQPASTIALVIEPRSKAGARALVTRARDLERRAAKLGGEVPHWVSLVARASEHDPEAPLALSEREIAVVPRLSALGKLDEFTEEIDRVRGDGRFSRRPAAL